MLNGSGNDLPAESTGLIGNMNPFRYRGYYYDVETGFYYLQSRYYDPQTGRFINADTRLNVDRGPLGTNLFTYCMNNPVRFTDPTGEVTGFEEIVAVAGIAFVFFAIAMVTVMVASTMGSTGDLFIYELINAFTGLNLNIVLSKSSSKSGKERATDKPSWVNKGMVDSTLSAQENAKRILDNKYGSGGWKKGPGGEYNQIVKWITRSLRAATYVPDYIDSSGTFYYDEFGNYRYSCYSPNYDSGYYSGYQMYIIINGNFRRVFE